MRRRSILVGLLSIACAPHQEGQSGAEKPSERNERPTGQAPSEAPNALLVLGNWSAPVSGWMQDLAVYEDGLIELLWFEPVERPGNPFARELRLKTMRVPSADLDALRKALAGAEFASAEPHYRQEGVLDGGALVIADQASHLRRVVIVNDPSDAPREVRATEELLDELATKLRAEGRDAFIEGQDRVVALWAFERGKFSKRLTVHANGLLELRTVYTTDEAAHAAKDYPTPYASTGHASPEDIRAPEAALAAARPEAVPPAQARDGTLWYGEGVEQHIPAAPDAALVTVLSVLEALELSVQPG